MTTDQTIVEVTTIITGAAFNAFVLWLLVHYRINRKWKSKKNETLRQSLEAYWVEIVITVVVVPQWPDVIRAGVKLLTGVAQ